MIFALTPRFATYVVLDFIGTDLPAKLVRFNLDLDTFFFLVIFIL